MTERLPQLNWDQKVTLGCSYFTNLKLEGGKLEQGR
jgi:hypothetical protein